MFRQAFCRVGAGSPCLGIPRVLFNQRRNALLLVFLLAPIAVSSPVTQASLPDPGENFLVDALLTETGRMGIQKSQARSGFASLNFVTFSSSSEVPAQSLNGSVVGTDEGRDYERYLYLLLTLGLILLAFRPASAAVAGRY